MIASVQPSMDASSNSSARRRCCLGVGIGARPSLTHQTLDRRARWLLQCNRNNRRCVGSAYRRDARCGSRAPLNPPAPLSGAAACIGHDGEPGGSERENDAVATVLIIGASRGIGLETVRAALEAGHSVRALARSARRIPVDHPKLERMAGDALEMATVKRALT